MAVEFLQLLVTSALIEVIEPQESNRCFGRLSNSNFSQAPRNISSTGIFVPIFSFISKQRLAHSTWDTSHCTSRKGSSLYPIKWSARFFSLIRITSIIFQKKAFTFTIFIRQGRLFYVSNVVKCATWYKSSYLEYEMPIFMETWKCNIYNCMLFYVFAFPPILRIIIPRKSEFFITRASFFVDVSMGKQNIKIIRKSSFIRGMYIIITSYAVYEKKILTKGWNFSNGSDAAKRLRMQFDVFLQKSIGGTL